MWISCIVQQAVLSEVLDIDTNRLEQVQLNVARIVTNIFIT